MVYKSIYYKNMNDSLMNTSGVHVNSTTHVQAPVQLYSTFMDIKKMKMPLLIRGRLLTAGHYREQGYSREVILSADELKASLDSWAGLKIYESHDVFEKIRRGQSVSINAVLGKILSVSWNEQDQGIDFEAEISDLSVAYKMVQGLIQSISAGFSRSIVRRDGMLVYTDIKGVETTLVEDPRDKNAVFQPVM